MAIEKASNLGKVQTSHGNGFKDIAGQKFGRLVALGFVGKNTERKALWDCVCDCGNRVVISGKSLRTGKTASCGCLKTERTKEANTRHGFAPKGDNHKLYYVWSSMKGRVLNPKNKAYKDYGGRGITIDPSWLDFATFKDWCFANGYHHTLSLDRIDNDNGYSPENCRWTTRQAQCRNRRSNVVYKGEYAVDASERLGGTKGLVAARLHNGWSIERAFTEPVAK